MIVFCPLHGIRDEEGITGTVFPTKKKSLLGSVLKETKVRERVVPLGDTKIAEHFNSLLYSPNCTIKGELIVLRLMMVGGPVQKETKLKEG